MDIYVINLDRSTERLREFRSNNAHLADIKRLSAVDGGAIDRRQLVASNVISSDLPYTSGAIGNALSHISCWKLATEGTSPITVCEDDAILHSTFSDQVPRLMASVPRD